MRYIALLRAVNVGGRVVKMDALRRHFESFGFTAVSTFIQTGNVVFDTTVTDVDRVARRIEDGLEAALGYRVDTFLRTLPGLAAVVGHRAFNPSTILPESTVFVGFVREPLDGAARRRILALAGEDNAFHVHGREVYWLRRVRSMESLRLMPLVEKAAACPMTMRNLSTLRKLLARYPSSSA